MAIHASASLPTVWNCNLSRPGYRLSRVADEEQPESKWVCVRTGARRDIDEFGCKRCPYWTRDPRTA